MERPLYINGAGGHARVCLDVARRSGRTVAAVVDPFSTIDELDGVTVKHEGEGLAPFIIAVGDNALRRRIAERYPEEAVAEALIDPSAVVSPSARIGAGSVVMAGAVVQAGAVIGRHSIINTGATVDHECRVGDYVHIAPGCHLCGNVTVGDGTLLGVGTVATPGAVVGAGCNVAAGSVVKRRIPDGSLASGNPCRALRRLSK